MGFAIRGFLYVVNLNQPSTLHGCQDMAPRDFGVTISTFWGHVTIIGLLALRFPTGSQFERTVYLAWFLRH